MEGKEFKKADDESFSEDLLIKEMYEELLFQIRKVNGYFRQVCKIPAGELTMLITIAKMHQKQQTIFPSDIEKVLRLSKPAISRMLHNIEKKGYINLKTEDRDHRYVQVELTERGEEIIQEEMNYCEELLRGVGKRMGYEDMKKLVYYNRRFCELLSDSMA